MNVTCLYNKSNFSAGRESAVERADSKRLARVESTDETLLASVKNGRQRDRHRRRSRIRIKLLCLTLEKTVNSCLIIFSKMSSIKADADNLSIISHDGEIGGDDYSSN